jgi:Na+-translocating ferredoxin:NAD+ oxidoreductase subunit E
MIIREEFRRALIAENPLFVCALGLCPALAVSSTAAAALCIGAATAAVLVCVAPVLSYTRRWIPENNKQFCHLIVICCAVTVIDLCLQAIAPDVRERCTIFVPLIAVNCLVITLARSSSERAIPLRAALNGAFTGIGFCIAITLIGVVREILGSGTIFGFSPLPNVSPIRFFALMPGGFILLGIALWILRRTRGGVTYKRQGTIIHKLS